MDNSKKLYVDIRLDDEQALFTDIRNLVLPSKSSKTDSYEQEPVILMNNKSDEKKKSKKKSKESKLMSLSSDIDFAYDDTPDDESDNSSERSLIDIDTIMEIRHKDDDDDIVKTQKKGYKKLKDNKNEYKKEFAEEITLLYNLMDETTKFGKALEKDLNAMRNTKVRGVSKYSNDLAELVLSSKQTKLNILKEIAGVKKTIADLAQKSEKTKANTEDSANKTERLASSYFKNILNHGRNNFIRSMDGYEDEPATYEESTYNGYADKVEYDYNKKLQERLDGLVNPFRSEEGGKYIEYEKLGVTVEVHKCIDTGEWEFIAIDKDGNVIDDYPVPTKKSAGRMKFSDDGTWCRDSLGRMYKIKEFYLDDEDDE